MGFGPNSIAALGSVHCCLNALTGIDGIWTEEWTILEKRGFVLMPLRALMGFGRSSYGPHLESRHCLNALTGIDGIWTHQEGPQQIPLWPVLMPLRALMGFGHW